jgi:hypothetical protein
VHVIRKHRHHDEDMGGRRSFLLVQYCCMKPDKARKYKKVSSANCFFVMGLTRQQILQLLKCQRKGAAILFCIAWSPS